MRNFPGIWSKITSKMWIFYNFSEFFGRKRPKYPSKWSFFPQNCKYFPPKSKISRHACLWPNTTKGTSCLLFVKIEIFALSNRRFNKLSNDTKFVTIKIILLKIQVLQGMNFLTRYEFPLIFFYILHTVLLIISE